MDYQPIETPFTRAFGLTAPIVCAPMALVAGGRLAAAVSRAGGLGLIGGGYGDGEWIEDQWLEAGNAAVGCGFITWRLQGREGLLEQALTHKPKGIFLSFGDLAPYAGRIKAAGVPLLAQVQTLAGAREALDQGADVIVAQGAEAGGHGSGRATFTLVPEVVDMVAGRVPVLAAGGIMDGRGLAAALALGADGVNLGSRFWASEEALVAKAQHGAALAADGDDTARTSLSDQARGFDWPGGWNMRALRNAWVRSWEGAAEGPVSDAARAEYAQGVAEGNADVAPAVVGEAVGLLHDILPAEEIIARMMREARDVLARGAAL
ncbi:NAD(P)H-dependent flavin oxidoreductase [Aquicoccus sp. G2-2]|uniref:NAD(P)H-dependent flavin oxidoreductase n=1 Tax=Aquicoccus sp. G2-2 TaxID=3092120 RepID=UPI002AE01F91|nr:nitronate monooxygenase [Aquicoccus sp. G2-2]MEA1113311.1 nitronate monooxygenase [Aquicoccus sp. G2-2]